MKFWFKNGLRRLKRFVSWFTVIWKDEDWDQAYIYEILRHKIQCQRLSLQKNARHLGYERTCKDMRFAEFLLDRLAKAEVYWDNYAAQKQEYCYCDREMLDTRNFIKISHNCSRIDWQPCGYCKQHIKTLDNQRNYERELVFKHISKHIEKWWD